MNPTTTKYYPTATLTVADGLGFELTVTVTAPRTSGVEPADHMAGVAATAYAAVAAALDLDD